MSPVSSHIRDLVSIGDLRAAEALQQTVWGIGERDVVPSHQLIAAREAGGLLIGAFDGLTLVGFAYGFPGLTLEGASIHSHLMAVLPAYRRHDIGARLKWAQRERALARGIDRITWTFDPLRTINAHLNFGKLGVVSNRYIVDFYPEEANNQLNRAGTDRLWVTWRLDAGRVTDRLSGRFPSPQPFHQMADRALVYVGDNGLPQVRNPPGDSGLLTIHVPPTVFDEASPDATERWRGATRPAFAGAIRDGYLVEEFYRPEQHGRRHGIYVLTRNGSHR